MRKRLTNEVFLDAREARKIYWASPMTVAFVAVFMIETYEFAGAPSIAIGLFAAVAAVFPLFIAAIDIKYWLIDSLFAGAWTCLLYTSPSPRDQRGSRMPSSA